MPLEHEQRLLDQIERELYAEDPKFASTVRGTRLRRPARRRRIQGIALFVVGVALLVLGVVIPVLRVADVPVVSVLGFLVMFFGVMMAVTSLHHSDSGGANSHDDGGGGSPPAARALSRSAWRNVSASASKANSTTANPRFSPRGGARILVRGHGPHRLAGHGFLPGSVRASRASLAGLVRTRSPRGPG